MKVLVAGAHGATGKHLIHKLSKKGYQPIAMIRDSKQAEELESYGAKTVVADLEGDLSQAVEGADAVIFAAGSGSKTGPEKTIAVDQEGAKSLIDAAKQHKVQHFVMLSSMGADQPDAGSEAMKNYLRAKAIADEYLIQSELSYTIVRPGTLSDEPGTGKITAEDSIQKRDRKIPREDVAEVLIQSLELEKTKNKTFEVLSGDKDVKEALQSLY
ncbi:SDR family oxidoreductase [Metabacillus sp. RGM 3146]|uniref:SDR family oxidoreductase n=1 Tax=Metabacillus sp. RGM 3146 TaxID=3401092 RepID=UPI003B9D3479